MWYRRMFSIHLIYIIVIAMQCTLVPEQVYTNYSSQVTQTLNQYKLQGHCSPLSVWGSTGTTWISSSLLWHPFYKAVLQRFDHLSLPSFAHKMWRSLVWIGRRPPHWQYSRGNVGSECSILHMCSFLFYTVLTLTSTTYIGTVRYLTNHYTQTNRNQRTQSELVHM